MNKILSLYILVLLFFSCSQQNLWEHEITGITVSPVSAVMKVNSSMQLTAAISPEDALQTITWTSSDETLATVDSNGLVAAIEIGYVTITAESSDNAEISGACDITIDPEDVTGLTVNPSAAVIIVNDTLQLTADIAPDDAIQTVTWTSSDETIATVDSDGLVSANAIIGTVTITATSSDNPGITADCVIQIDPRPVTGLTVNPSTSTIIVNDLLQLTAVITPADATDQTVTWTSSDVTLVTVDSDGLVTAKAVGGPVTITATSSDNPGITADCVIQIDPRPVTGLTVSPLSAVIIVKYTLQLTADITPADATDQTVTWTSSDETLATVGSDGLVTSIKTGTVTITATSVNNSAATDDCIITIDPLPACITATAGTGTGATTTYTLLDGTMFTTIQATEDVVTSITFPTGTADLTTSAITAPVIFAETETTYELWSTVYQWAVNNGYTFSSYSALCGSNGSGSIQQPAAGITWYDSIVWCNALTEYYNANNETTDTDLVCVYYNDSTYTTPIHSTSDTYILTPYIYSGSSANMDSSSCTATGFRLPASKEWEYAARYRGTDNTNAVLVDGIYYTTGASASGAWTTYDDASDSNSNSIPDGTEAINDVAVAVCAIDYTGITSVVKTKLPNTLGLYDMSGNISEWCFDLDSTWRVLGGGSWYQITSLLQIGNVGSYYPTPQYNWCGFRVIRNR